MINKISLITLVSFLGLSLSSCSHFSEHKHEKYGNKLFENMDQNNDGFVTNEEYKKFNNEMFAKMDANKDGKICKQEFWNYIKSRHNHDEEHDKK